MQNWVLAFGTIFFLSATSLSCGSAETNIVVSGDFFLEPHFLQMETARYQAMRASEKLGEMTIQTYGNSDSVTIETVTTIQGMNIRQKVATTISRKTFLPLSHSVSGIMGDITIDIRLSWKDRIVSGYTSFPLNAQNPEKQIIRHELPPGTLERTSVFALARTFPLADCHNFHFLWYNTLEDDVKEVSATVSDSASVSTPAGDFSCYRVDIEGDEPALVIYISKQLPRKVVRIEILGLPWTFDLLEVVRKEP
ncbi:MAG: hypothetical protein R3C61_14575 [Bacteroidia bacterium]